MLTIFAVPKPFEGHVGVIQRNAIRSWTRLRPRCQVILCGDEPGTGEVAVLLGAEWIPSVNADIVLLPDFVEAARRVVAARRRFLTVGRRWDLDVSEQGWTGESLRRRLRTELVSAPPLRPPRRALRAVWKACRSTTT